MTIAKLLLKIESSTTEFSNSIDNSKGRAFCQY